MRRFTLAFAVAIALPALPAAQAQQSESRPCSYDPAPAANPRIVRGELDGLPYNVLLPSDYASSGVRYPVLYLLHGGELNENTWLHQTDIEGFTEPFTGASGVIVVMPNGGPGGFYTDWEEGDQQWETYHLRRLLPAIDAGFRTLADRRHRAIAGFSLGGLGAMEYAARQPDLFSVTASFSGLVHLTAWRDPYTGPAPVEDRSGDGEPGPARTPPEPRPYQPPTEAGSGCGGGEGSAFGDPVANEIAWRSHDPSDLASVLARTTVYVGAGNSIPCPGEPDTPDHTITGPIEPGARKLAQDFDAALTAAGVEHTTDIDSCGLHDMIGAERQLRTFWPLMAAAFADPPERPKVFSLRRSEETFGAYGWRFVAQEGRAREFLEVTAASRAGVTLAGSGTVTVRTGRLFAPRQRVRLRGALPQRTRAGKGGRIRFRVDLGPPHRTQQFTPGAEQELFVQRRVTFATTGHRPSQRPSRIELPRRSGRRS